MTGRFRTRLARASGVLVSVVAVGVLAACGSDDSDGGGAAGDGGEAAPLLIGVDVSLTGGLASIGKDERDGMLLAAEEINAKGGVEGRKIELEVLDDASDPKTAISNTTRLLARDVVAITGYPAGVTQIPTSAPLVRSNVLTVALAGASEGQATGPAYFNLGIQLKDSAAALTCYAEKAVSAQRVGMISTNDAGTQAIFTGLAELLGNRVVANEVVPLGATDVTVAMTKIKDANPDLLIDGANGPTGVLVVKTAKSLKMTQPILGYNGMATEAIAQLGGADLNGVVVQNLLSASDPLDFQKAFLEAWDKKYDAPPSSFSGLGYDSIYVIAEAVKAMPDATKEDGVKLAEALESTDIRGVVGAYNFDVFDPDDFGPHAGLSPDDVVWTVAKDGTYVQAEDQPDCSS